MVQADSAVWTEGNCASENVGNETNQDDLQFLVSFEKQKVYSRLFSTPTDVSSAGTSPFLLYLSDSIHGHKHNYQNTTNIPCIIIIIIIFD
jgi:hypothetical protein